MLFLPTDKSQQYMPQARVCGFSTKCACKIHQLTRGVRVLPVAALRIGTACLWLTSDVRVRR